MDLERYRALLCAIEEGSLSAAAEKLCYTPSGVSRIVSALEEETGFPLLLRERNGVRPTADCERMLPSIRELLFCGERCTQLSAQIRGLNVGTVVVGTAYSAYYMWLAKVTSAFRYRSAADTARNFCKSWSSTRWTSASSASGMARTSGSTFARIR